MPKRQIFVTEDSDKAKKCGRCNYTASIFYGLGHTLKDARSHYKELGEKRGKGLCATCMTEFLQENDFLIERPD